LVSSCQAAAILFLDRADAVDLAADYVARLPNDRRFPAGAFRRSGGAGQFELH
jgi:hypothetical protein